MDVMCSRRYAGRTSIVITKHLLCSEFNTEVNDFTQGPPQPAVDGSAWDFGDVRRWEWMHDGYEVNGWIEFLSGGVLRTSFERKTITRKCGVSRRTATSRRRSAIVTTI